MLYLPHAAAERPWLGPDADALADLQELALVSLYEFGKPGSAEVGVLPLPSGGSGFGLGGVGTIDCRVSLNNASVAGAIQIHPTGRRAYVGTDEGIAVLSISTPGLGDDETCDCRSGSVCVGLQTMHNEDSPHPYSLRLSPDGQYLLAFGTAGAELGRIGDLEGATMVRANTQQRAFILSTQAVGGRPVRPCPPAATCEETDRLASGGICPPDQSCLDERAQQGDTRPPLSGRTSFSLNFVELDSQEVVMDSAFSPDGRRIYVLTSIPYSQIFTRCFKDGRKVGDQTCPGSIASGLDVAHLGIYDAEATAAGSFGLASPRQFKKIGQVDLGMRVPIPEGHERPLEHVDETEEREWLPGRYHRTNPCANSENCSNTPLAHFDAAESLQVSPDGQYLYIASHGLVRRVNGLRAYDRDIRLSGGVGVLDVTKIEHAIADSYEATDPSAVASGSQPTPPRIDAADALVDFIAKEVPMAEGIRSTLLVADAWVEGLPLLMPLCGLSLILGVAGTCGWALIGLAVMGIFAIIDWTRSLPYWYQPVRVTGHREHRRHARGRQPLHRCTQHRQLLPGRAPAAGSRGQRPGASGRNNSLDYGEIHAWTTFYEHALFVATTNVFLMILNPGLTFRTTPRTLSAMVRTNIEREPKWRRRFMRALSPRHGGIDDSRFSEVVGSDKTDPHYRRWPNRPDLSAEATWGKFQKHRNESLGYGKATRFAFTRDWALIYTHGDVRSVRKLRVARRSALEALAGGGGLGSVNAWHDPLHASVPFIPTLHPVDEVVAGNLVLTAPDVLAPESQEPVMFSNSEACTNCGAPNPDNELTRVGWVATLPETDRDDDGMNDLVEAYNSYYWLSDDDAEEAVPQSDGPIPGLKDRAEDKSVLARWVSEPFAGDTLYDWEAEVVRRAAPTEANNWAGMNGSLDARVHGGAGVEYGERLDCWVGQRAPGQAGRALHYIGGPGCDDPYDGVDADFVDGAFHRLSQLDGEGDPSREAEHNRDKAMVPLGLFLPSRGIGYHHPPRGDTYLTDSFGTVRLVQAITRAAGRWALRFPEGPPMVVGDLSRIGGGQFVGQRKRRLGPTGGVMLPAMHHTHFMGVEAEVGYLLAPVGGCGEADPCASGFTGAGGDEETFEVGRHPSDRWHPQNGELIAWLTAEDFIERVNINRAVLALVAPDAPSEDDAAPQAVDSVFANLGPSDADPSKIVAHQRHYTQAMSIVVDRPSVLELASVDVTVQRGDGGDPADFTISGTVEGEHCVAGNARVTITLQQNGRALRDNEDRVVTLELEAALDEDCNGEFTLDSLRDEVMNAYDIDAFEDAIATGEPPVIGVFLERDGPMGGPSHIGEAFASTADAASFALERFELHEGDPSDRDDNGRLNERVVWAATHRVQMLDPLGIPLGNAPIQFLTPDEAPELRITAPDCPEGAAGGCCAAGTCFTDENGYAWVTSLNDLKTRAELEQVMHSVSLVSASSQAQLGLTVEALAAADIVLPDGDISQKECDKLRFSPVDRFVQNVNQQAGQAIDGVLTNKGQTADEMGSYFWVAYRAAMEQRIQHYHVEAALEHCLQAEQFEDVPEPAKRPWHVANLWFTGQQLGLESGRAAAIKDQVEDAFLLLNAPQQFGQLARSIAKLALLGDRSTPARQCTESEIGAAVAGLGYCDAMTVRCNPELAQSVGREGSFLWTLDQLNSSIGSITEDLGRTLCPGLTDETKPTCTGGGGTYSPQMSPQAVATLDWSLDTVPAQATLTTQAEPLPTVSLPQPERSCETEDDEGHDNVAELVLSMIFGSTNQEIDKLWDAAKGAADAGKHGTFFSFFGPIDPQLHDGVKTYFRIGHYVGYFLGWIAAEIVLGLATAALTAGAALIVKALRGVRLLAKLGDKLSRVTEIVKSIRRKASALPGLKKGLKAVRMTSTFVAIFGAFENPAQGGLMELLGGTLGNVRAVEALKQNAQSALLEELAPSGEAMADVVASSMARTHPDSEATDAGEQNLASIGLERQHQLYVEALAGVRSAREPESEVGQQALRLVTELLADPRIVLPVTTQQSAGLGVLADGAAKLDQLQEAAVDPARKLETCETINRRCE